MNAIRLTIATLAGLLIGTQSALAIERPLPFDDGGSLLVALVGLVAVIGIARGKNKR